MQALQDVRNRRIGGTGDILRDYSETEGALGVHVPGPLRGLGAERVLGVRFPELPRDLEGGRRARVPAPTAAPSSSRARGAPRLAILSLLPFLASSILLQACTLAGGRPGPPPEAPTPAPEAWTQTGIASWYGRPFHGRQTASGETYDMNALTGAHPELPFGTLLRVDNLDNGHSVTIRINDRGPFVKERILDVSRRAAEELGMIGPGTARVRIIVVGRGAPKPTEGRGCSPGNPWI